MCIRDSVNAAIVLFSDKTSCLLRWYDRSWRCVAIYDAAGVFAHCAAHDRCAADVGRRFGVIEPTGIAARQSSRSHTARYRAAIDGVSDTGVFFYHPGDTAGCFSADSTGALTAAYAARLYFTRDAAHIGALRRSNCHGVFAV